jgi:Domain of unknown function (DUF6456)
MARRRPTRAGRRRAEKEAANLAARERGVAAAEEAKTRPRVARHVDQLDQLLMRREISADQAAAGMRFQGDFRRAGSATIGRLVGTYEANMPRPPKKYQAPGADPLAAVVARERFEQACRELGPLCAVVIHVAVLDQPAEEWGATPERRNGDALALLRLGLATLNLFYGRQRYGAAINGFPAAVPMGAPEASAAPATICPPRNQALEVAVPPA